MRGIEEEAAWAATQFSKLNLFWRHKFSFSSLSLFSPSCSSVLCTLFGYYFAFSKLTSKGKIKGVGIAELSSGLSNASKILDIAAILGLNPSHEIWYFHIN